MKKIRKKCQIQFPKYKHSFSKICILLRACITLHNNWPLQIFNEEAALNRQKASLCYE